MFNCVELCIELFTFDQGKGMPNNNYNNLPQFQVEMINAHNGEPWQLKDIQQEHYNNILLKHNINDVALKKDTNQKKKLLQKTNDLAVKKFLACLFI